MRMSPECKNSKARDIGVAGLIRWQELRAITWS
jgi:hypothetical protein